MKRRVLRLTALLLVLLLCLTGCISEDLQLIADAVSDTMALVDETNASQPAEEPEVAYGETYSTADEVALYLHLYRELPPNFLTKEEARELGWDNSQGNLWTVAPGKSIGGDRFGNREGVLPDGNYYECDVNYEGGYRGAERIVWSEDGAVYYTNDHYESFTQLYEAWAS